MIDSKRVFVHFYVYVVVFAVKVCDLHMFAWFVNKCGYWRHR